MAKWYFVRKRAVIIFIVLTLFFLSCEIFSRTSCGKFTYRVSPCFDLYKKYYSEKVNPESLINRDDIAKIIATRTIEVDQSEIQGLNGISCYDMNYVSRDLPHRAKNYVKVHEAIHLSGNYNETQTNYLAAQREPIGFIETIVYSVYVGIKNGGWKRPHCYLGRAWNIFKMYFLNIQEDFIQ